MAIKLDSLAKKTVKEFNLFGRKMNATYSSETDDVLIDTSIEMEDTYNKMQAPSVDDMTLEEKKTFIKKTSKEVFKEAHAFLEVVFNKDDADYLLKKITRLEAVIYLVATVRDAGGIQMPKNREQRRSAGK